MSTQSQTTPLAPEQEARRWRYGCSHRPPQYAAVPNGYDECAGYSGFLYGIVIYPHKLTDKEVSSYELTPLDDPELVVDYRGVTYRITVWLDGGKFRYAVMQEGGKGDAMLARGTCRNGGGITAAVSAGLQEVAYHVEDNQR